MNPEIGRELKAEELKVGTVVVIKPPSVMDIYMTVWVRSLDAKLVGFYAGAGKPPTLIINFIQPDGSIVDDKGRAVRVFEYLGEP